MRSARGVLEQDDARLVLAAVVERARVKVQGLTAVTAVADHVPGGDDAFASRNAKGRDTGCRLLGLWLIGVAERQRLRLAAPEHPLIDVSTPVPIPGGAVVVMKLDDDVVAGPIAEGYGPCGGLCGLGAGAGAGRKVLVRVILAVRQGSEYSQGQKEREICQGRPNCSGCDHHNEAPCPRCLDFHVKLLHKQPTAEIGPQEAP